MRVNVAIPETTVSAPVLNAALEAVTRLDERLIKSGAPTFKQLLDQGVKWRPEPPGGEHFDHVGLVAARGWGDCDDLAPAHAATLRVTGQDPDARAVVRKSGPKRWHAVVRRGDGRIEDPSLAAGMKPGVKHGVRGAALPLMFGAQRNDVGAFIQSPHVALRPIRDRQGSPTAWQARSDLPWHWQPGSSPGDIALASLHQSPLSDQALVGACLGAVRLGEACGFMSDYDLDRMEAIAEGCQGASWEELAEVYGEDHADMAGDIIEGFFGSLMKKAKGLAKKGLKLAPDLISFVPGVGPAASMAIKTVSPMLAKQLSKKKHIRPSKRPISKRGAASILRPPKRRITYPRPSSTRSTSSRGGMPQAFVCYPAPGPGGR